VQNRLELITLELREEKSRAISLVIWAALLIFLSFMSMIVITFLFVVAFWEQAIWVLAGFGVFYLASALIAVAMIRSRLKAPLFGETIYQLKKDREWLLSRK
jgi:uncharacterized membrane protein YqjE